VVKQLISCIVTGCVVAGCTMISSKASAGQPDIIGHRGASHDLPENTLPAMVKAWRDGADGAELDIHRSPDGKAVIMHDKTTSRTAPGTNYAIIDTPYSVLRNVDVGSWKNPKFKDIRIPLLDDVLDAMPPKQKLYIEVKSDSTILPEVKRLVDASGKKENIIIIGFEFDTMKDAKKLMPEIPVYWLLGTKKNPITKQPLRHKLEWVKQAKDAGFEGVDVQFTGLDLRFTKAVRAAGLDLAVWTVDEVKDMRRMIKLGVDSITTNKPLYLQRVMLADMKKKSPGKKRAKTESVKLSDECEAVNPGAVGAYQPAPVLGLWDAHCLCE
jgi:glycerophosphoryl diester phosphodiesterase